MATLFIDSSFVAYSKMFVCRKEATEEEGMGLWRYYYMRDIFKYIEMFDDIDEVIIARDSSNNWRKDVFNWYKGPRKIGRKHESAKLKAKKHWFNYSNFYEFQDNFINDMKENLPFKVLEAPRTEADDIIAILCKTIKGPKYVITTDHDYIQLMKDPEVKIYSPMKKAFLESDNPHRDMMVKILSGDTSDFIPSINNTYTHKDEFLQFCVNEGMAENVKFAKVKLDNDEDLMFKMQFKFMEEYDGVSPSKKRTFTERNAKHHLDEGTLKQFFAENKGTQEKFNRNNKLVNLEKQPAYIKEGVYEIYDNYEMPKTNIMKFFLKNKFRGFINDMDKYAGLIKPIKR